tara:strand:- start:688 stop:1299 length:612 start_codon:yes stop_codon:yes gene_type:complete
MSLVRDRSITSTPSWNLVMAALPLKNCCGGAMPGCCWRYAGVVMLVLLPLSVVCEADEIAELYDQARFFQGNWSIEIEEAGKKTSETARCVGTAGKCNIWFGQDATSMHGYDPRTRAWRGVGHFKDGSRWERVISQPAKSRIVSGTTMVFSDITFHPDGTKTFATVKFTCLGPDRFREVTTRKDQDGNPLPMVQTVSRRVPPK